MRNMNSSTHDTFGSRHSPRAFWIKKTFLFGCLLLLAHSASRGAVFNVDIEPFSFNPTPVNINVNDQVVWTWVSDFHNSVSDSGQWDSGLHNSGFEFTHTFPNAGTFPYHCTVHGFAGTVNVLGGNGAPTVAISSPTNGATFTAPANVPIMATA